MNLENDGDLYRACSNPTNVVLVIVLGKDIGKGAEHWEHQIWLMRHISVSTPKPIRRRGIKQ